VIDKSVLTNSQTVPMCAIYFRPLISKAFSAFLANLATGLPIDFPVLAMATSLSVYFGVKVADFFEQLWCRCNTLTILKESLTAERIAWFATQRIQRIGGLP
jgi:hypothetical protein